MSFAILLNKDRRPQAFDIEEIPAGSLTKQNAMKGKGGTMVPFKIQIGESNFASFPSSFFGKGFGFCGVAAESLV